MLFKKLTNKKMVWEEEAVKDLGIGTTCLDLMGTRPKEMEILMMVQRGYVHT